MGDRRWWFVRRHHPEEAPSGGDWFEVQLLDQYGACVAFARFSAGTTRIEIAGELVPPEVIRVAEQRSLRDGQYVDSEGRLTDMHGLLLNESP